MNVMPLRDFLVVAKKDVPTQTPGGLYVPGNVEEKVITGTVLAVGSGRVCADGTVVPLEVKVEDQVVFNKHAAAEVKVGVETFLLLKEEHVLCVLK